MNLECRVCEEPIKPDVPYWRYCCSPECARVLMMLTGLAALDTDLAVLIEATNPREYSAGSSTRENTLAAWLGERD